jgi:predicted GNAT family N-acyltransferase
MQSHYELKLLCPSDHPFASKFHDRRIEEPLYDKYVSSLQRLRGPVYLADGAVQPWELDEDGRYWMRDDEKAWHLVLIDAEDEVIGCARYLVHPPQTHFHKLRVSHSALARDPRWGPRLREAVERELSRAADRKFVYIEPGGWAVNRRWRNTKAAVNIVLSSYALGSILGGGLGICTATHRHESASILKRLGGNNLVTSAGDLLTTYFDPEYGCTMELLKFDSRFPAERVAPLAFDLRSRLEKSPVIMRPPTQFDLRDIQRSVLLPLFR